MVYGFSWGLLFDMNLILLSPQVKLNLLHSKTSLLIVPFNEHERMISNPILILENTSMNTILMATGKFMLSRSVEAVASNMC